MYNNSKVKIFVTINLYAFGLLLSAVLLSGCGGGTSNDSNPPPPPPAQNQSPTSNAGADQTVDENTVISLMAQELIQMALFRVMLGFKLQVQV